MVGVLEARGNVFGQSLDNVAIVPAESPARAFLARPGNVNGIVIQTTDPADIPVALGDAEAALRVERRLRPSEPSDFDLETADDSLAFWNRISTVLFLALPGLVGISLVVGGIVIMTSCWCRSSSGRVRWASEWPWVRAAATSSPSS